ncbi:hypothetical protein BGW38_008407 [Lunasporangiospora selenospora]|uniref:CAP-Gly domain-containing protein n=1 Tax=Lunasporangiospora selenospora TaxID=979761 RepID=A0A9P6FXW5_9FUNG|nr:hypothetical protein BGW38_008407 [Lunasporangiospora selenospora]
MTSRLARPTGIPGANAAATRQLRQPQPTLRRPSTGTLSSSPYQSETQTDTETDLDLDPEMDILHLPLDHPPLVHLPPEHAPSPAALDSQLEIGDRVYVESMGLSGYLGFLGPTAFKDGIWAGIELDTPTGKNDGSVGGIAYFTCRPRCGIFVLAGKIVKAEVLLPYSTAANTLAGISTGNSAGHLDHGLTSPTPPRPTSSSAMLAAQAAARITAGSRASKYIGVTASQLKQRQATTPQLVPPQKTREDRIGTSLSPKKSMTGMAGGSKIGQSGSGPMSVTPSGIRPGMQSRSGSSAAGTNSPSHTVPTALSSPRSLTRPRTSPTPGKLPQSPRKMSSTLSLSSIKADPAETTSSLLDQTTLLQMAGSNPRSHVNKDLTTQLQQLQLNYGVAMAENNMLKTEMSQAKSQLEMSRLKRSSLLVGKGSPSPSYDSSSVVEDRLAQELEHLQRMRAAWEKEREEKDEEISIMTEKMTQAWLDVAKSQKERAALLQDKAVLEEKLRKYRDQMSSGGSVSGGSRLSFSHDPDEFGDARVQELKELREMRDLENEMMTELQQELGIAAQKIDELELEIETLKTRARIEEEESKARELAKLQSTDEELEKAAATAMAESQAELMERLSKLEHERDDLQLKLDALERVLETTTKEWEAKLEMANQQAEDSLQQLREAQDLLELETETWHQIEAVSESRVKRLESELEESQDLLAKSEKACKSMDEKIKEYESTMSKREQEITQLRNELDDLAGMVQSDEVDRMRKVWENEKKRLEDAVAEDLTMITTLRSEIQTLESNEESLQIKVKELEADITALILKRR